MKGRLSLHDFLMNQRAGLSTKWFSQAKLEILYRSTVHSFSSSLYLYIILYLNTKIKPNRGESRPQEPVAIQRHTLMSVISGSVSTTDGGAHCKPSYLNSNPNRNIWIFTGLFFSIQRILLFSANKICI